tara:strand:- start:27335 stop:27556 length:222 start_codon:yes stop_codon:yes gene_type:complete
MNFLQQPVLFSSEPASGLVGLGLILTLAAIVVAVSLVVTFAYASSKAATPERPCQKKPRQAQQDPDCTGAALS